LRDFCERLYALPNEWQTETAESVPLNTRPSTRIAMRRRFAEAALNLNGLRSQAAIVPPDDPAEAPTRKAALGFGAYNGESEIKFPKSPRTHAT
jgi:hypothetical protein